MKKTIFNEDSELQLTVSFTKSAANLDFMQKQLLVLKYAAFMMGLEWYQIAWMRMKILKSKAVVIFSKTEMYKTEVGAPITLFSYFSNQYGCPAGKEKQGKVLWIGKDSSNNDVVTADCQSSYHDLQCCKFKETIPISK